MKRKIISCLLALVLTLTLLPVIGASAAIGAEVNVDRIVAATEEFMIGHEGKYDSVSCNDSGALSIGKLQWHAIRALGLMKRIVAKNPEQAASLLGSSLYHEIVNSDVSAWRYRSVTSYEASLLSKVLGSAEGIEAQDEQAYEDISGYIEHGYALNIRSDNALMYYCDIENQYGNGGAVGVVDKAFSQLGRSRANGDTINTLEEFHNALLNSPYSSVQNYIARRKKTYTFIKNLNWGDYDAACENCASVKFWDVPGAAHWSHEGIDFVLEQKLFQGVSENEFAPNGIMTRAMLVTVLFRLDGEEKTDAANAFTDVPQGKWFTDAVNWANALGIVTGEDETTFNPGAYISREQIATILYRYTISKEYPMIEGGSLAAFSDSERTANYALDALAWATSVQLINGELKNGVISLNPSGEATRAQVATILMRYFNVFLAQSETPAE